MEKEKRLEDTELARSYGGYKSRDSVVSPLTKDSPMGWCAYELCYFTKTHRWEMPAWTQPDLRAATELVGYAVQTWWICYCAWEKKNKCIYIWGKMNFGQLRHFLNFLSHILLIEQTFQNQFTNIKPSKIWSLNSFNLDFFHFFSFFLFFFLI